MSKSNRNKPKYGKVMDPSAFSIKEVNQVISFGGRSGSVMEMSNPKKEDVLSFFDQMISGLKSKGIIDRPYMEILQKARQQVEVTHK